MVTSIAMAEQLMAFTSDFDDDMVDIEKTTEGVGNILDEFGGYNVEGMSQRDRALLQLLLDCGFLTDGEMKSVINEMKKGKKDIRAVLVDMWISAETYQTLLMYITGKKDAD